MTPAQTDPNPDTEGRPAVLLVEDDAQLGPMLVELLSEFYTVRLARDGQSGLHLALTGDFDALVVDRGLPVIEGADLVARLRRFGVLTPAILLTALGTVQDRVEGLDAGAEDYLVKPFEVEELLARVRALLRRHSDSSDVIAVGERRLDVAARLVTGGAGPDVDLTASECRLLEVFARNPRQVFGREKLLSLVFERDETPNTVDTYVHYLRRKLGRDAVTTVRGLGYRLGTP